MSGTIVRAPQPLDLGEYQSDEPETAFYGLPKEIRFCAECTYSNQKPNSEREFRHDRDTRKPTLSLDEDGVCRACRVAQAKERVDWSARRDELAELCARYRRDDGRPDVLVPGSGGKDSFFASWVLKHEFGMNPLTITWAPHLYTDWGRRNHQAWMGAGFDNVSFSPNTRVQRLVTRLALERILHPFQPFMMGQMYFAPKFAAKYDIPLVFYGENPSEYGNVDSNNAPTKDLSYFSTNDRSAVKIGGASIDELVEEFGLSLHDIDPYLPPTTDELASSNINVQYLGYYLKWHPQSCYYYAIEHGGFQPSPERNLGTYSKYSSIDDKMDDFHYFTTFIKFGIGRATYDTSQEIRNGDITRDEGVALVKKYDGEYPDRFQTELFEYLSIDEKSFPAASSRFEQPMIDTEYFNALIDTFRSPHLWRRTAEGWRLRRAVYG